MNLSAKPHRPLFLSMRVALLFFQVAVVCFSARSSTPNIATDQSALLSLKARIKFNGANHPLVSNWTPSSPVCSWIGVLCSARHLRVATLDLRDMGLVGTIPPELGNLSFLVRLNISNNSFHGELPEELGHLRRLEYINIKLNNFGGQIPSWLGALTTLQYLNFGNNSFSGPLPQEIGNLHKLKTLVIQYNNLTGVLPLSIFNISSLTAIYLSFNGGLSGNLPADMCNHLPNLEFLGLSDNKLEGPIPTSFQECSKLQVLSLSINKFTGTIPTQIGNLTVLNTLYLGGNNLEGMIPSFIFNISSLQYLDLPENNFFGSLPSGMCSKLSLVHIVLGTNNLTGSIPRDIGNCTTVQILDFSSNRLSGEIPEEISNLWNLEFLSLQYNELSGPIPATVFNHSMLGTISLVGNHLSGTLPPTLGLWLPKLKNLYLEQNQLFGNLPDSISNASNLAELDLSTNYFTGTIPNSIGNLGLLQYLYLGNNTFTGHESSSFPEFSFLTSLTKCRQLRELWIEFNPLNVVLPASIGNLSTSLDNLRLDNCEFTGKIPTDIGNLSSLSLLELGGNQLTGSLPQTIRELQKLQQLFFNGNSLHESIPDDVCQLHNLGLLALQANQLSGPVPPCLGNITSLRYLYLHANKLNSSIPASLWNLKDLLELDLSSNSFIGNLTQTIGSLRAVTQINLSWNQLSSEIPTTIGGLQTLTNLGLSHNRFHGFIPRSFGNMISLNFLDLSNNNLSGEIPMSLEALSQLGHFNVSFNRLRGQIPSGGPFKNFTYQSFESNEGLCGASRFNVPPCYDGFHQQSRTKRVLLYILVSFGIALIILGGTSAFALLRCQRKTQVPIVTILSPAITHARISYHEIVQATNSFDESNLLGTGSFSSVYKAVLNDGAILAVKVFNLQLEGAFKSFDKECEMLRYIRHRNLTKVISSCSNLDFKALALEYMPNGSLEKWLYFHNNFLDIRQRLDIMIDVASALVYLHHGYSMPMVHCDLKPSNVLLDEQMVAHVSDFGIAKFLRNGECIAQTCTLGTIGYIAPEYGREGLVSTMCDVYSFGIMLMEMLTRRRPTDEAFARDLCLKQWVHASIHSDSGVIHVIDANLLRQEDEEFDSKVQCVSSILELALNCTAESPEDRTNMEDVLASLKKIKLSFLTKLRSN